MEDLLGRCADHFQRALEVRQLGLVGTHVLGRDDIVDRRLDVAQRVLDDVAVGVRDDHQLEPGIVRTPQRRRRVGEWLPRAHRPGERLAVVVGIRPAAFL
jgi:hypothetical protein